MPALIKHDEWLCPTCKRIVNNLAYVMEGETEAEGGPHSGDDVIVRAIDSGMLCERCFDRYTAGWPLWKHAVSWWMRLGRPVPERNTPEWQTMYEAWIDYAFEKGEP